MVPQTFIVFCIAGWCALVALVLVAGIADAVRSWVRQEER